jgi:phenylacetate-CoA ligase
MNGIDMALYQSFTQVFADSLRTTRAEIETYQITALSELLVFAIENTAHYKRYPKLSSSNPRQFWRLWRDLPILQRAELQRSNADFFARGLPTIHGATHRDTTSGSTGRPLVCLASDLEERIFEAVDFFGHTAIHGRDPALKICIIKSYPGDFLPPGRCVDSPSWGRVAHHLGTSGPCRVLNVSTATARQVELIDEFNPAYLATIPSNLEAIIEPLLTRVRAGRLNIREFITFGDTVSERLAATIRSANAKLSDVYSATETGIVAFQCPDQGENYHVVLPTAYVELLDEGGRPCELGKIGRVIVTPLYKHAMPLIRYELGDYAIARARCSCGRPWPTIGKIVGRDRNMFKFPDGSLIWPAFNAYKFRDFVDFESCQVAQVAPLSIELRLVADPDAARAADIDGLTAYIRRLIDQPVTITIKIVDRIASYDNLKFHDYVREFE